MDTAELRAFGPGWRFRAPSAPAFYSSKSICCRVASSFMSLTLSLSLSLSLSLGLVGPSSCLPQSVKAVLQQKKRRVHRWECVEKKLCFCFDRATWIRLRLHRCCLQLNMPCPAFRIAREPSSESQSEDGTTCNSQAQLSYPSRWVRFHLVSKSGHDMAIEDSKLRSCDSPWCRELLAPGACRCPLIPNDDTVTLA